MAARRCSFPAGRWKYALIPFTVSAAIFPRVRRHRGWTYRRNIFNLSRKCLARNVFHPLFTFDRVFLKYFPKKRVNRSFLLFLIIWPPLVESSWNCWNLLRTSSENLPLVQTFRIYDRVKMKIEKIGLFESDSKGKFLTKEQSVRISIWLLNKANYVGFRVMESTRL